MIREQPVVILRRRRIALAATLAPVLALARVAACPAGELETVLSDSSREYLLAEHMEMLRDPSRSLTIADVAAPAASERFRPVTARRPNLGYTRDALWFHFRVRNATGREEWVLSVGKEWTEEAELFLRSEGAGWRSLKTGVVVPYASRPLPHEDPLFPIHLQTGETVECYLAVRSATTPLMLHLSLVEKDREALVSALTRLSYGSLYFVLLVMALYHLTLALSLKDGRFLLIGIFLVCYLVLESGVHGHLALLLFPTAPLLAQRLVPVASSAGGIAVLLFAQRILDTRRAAPFLHRLLTAGCVVEAGMVGVTALTIAAHEAVFWVEGAIAVVAQGAGIKRCLP